jgi:hypothetical protein
MGERKGKILRDPHKPADGHAGPSDAPVGMSGIEYDVKQMDQEAYNYSRASQIVNARGCSHCYDVYKEGGNKCPMCGLSWPDIT